MNEKLSAFIDNELSELEERRLLGELAHDSQLHAAWERYHLIGSALRKEFDHIAPAGLPERVTHTLADIQIDRAPRRLGFTIGALTIGKAIGGLAIAASVTVVAILNLPSFMTPHDGTEVVAKTAATPVAAQVTARSSTATDPLNAYLIEHNEFAPVAGMGNMLPYVRSVQYDTNQ